MIVGQGEYRYEPLVGWMKLPEGWAVQDLPGLVVGPDDLVYLYHRGTHPVIALDTEGNVKSSWGDGVFKRPHSVRVDKEGMVFCVDDWNHAITKFNAKGEPLLTLGTPGKPSDTGAVNMYYRTIKRAAGPFNCVTDIAFAPNGDLFASDGYGNARVHHFSKDGELIKSWGQPGSRPGQFNLPHAIIIDKQGRVFIADRENSRVQVFSQEGDLLQVWSDATRASSLALDAKGNVIVGEFGFNVGSMYGGDPVPPRRPMYARVTVRSPEGEVLSSFGTSNMCAPGNFWAPHCIGIDSHQNLYVGEVSKTTNAPAGCHVIQKLVKQ